MSASETRKAALQRARGELRDAATEARRAAADAKDETASRLAKARSTRDTLRAQVHHDLFTELQSLESEQGKLAVTARAQTGPVGAKTEQRVHDLETRIGAVREEFVAHADVTLDEIDEEISALETAAKDGHSDARQKAEESVNELKGRRDELREKAATFRVATGERLNKATTEFDQVMSELTEKRNEGFVGLN
jgi:uncharacterized coiled-coil DUF342 family protein